jgi:hypothetical protein
MCYNHASFSLLEAAMAEHKGESWLELCELAAQEQDPKKLISLLQEIDQLLAAEDQCRKERGVA